MEIRDVIDSDWAGVWGFMQPILAAGDTYCWPTDTTEEAARTWWLGKTGGRVFVAVEVRWWEPPSFTRTSQVPAVTLPTQASWCRRPQPAEVSDAPWPATYSKSHRGRSTRQCSSTLSWRPTSTRSGCGSRSASRFLPPCRRRSDILTGAWSGFTSCTGSCDSPIGPVTAPHTGEESRNETLVA